MKKISFYGLMIVLVIMSFTACEKEEDSPVETTEVSITRKGSVLEIPKGLNSVNENGTIVYPNVSLNGKPLEGNFSSSANQIEILEMLGLVVGTNKICIELPATQEQSPKEFCLDFEVTIEDIIGTIEGCPEFKENEDLNNKPTVEFPQAVSSFVRLAVNGEPYPNLEIKVADPQLAPNTSFVYTRELEGLVAGDNTLSFTFVDGLAISNCDTTTPFVVNLFVHETPTEECPEFKENEDFNDKPTVEFPQEVSSFVRLAVNGEPYPNLEIKVADPQLAPNTSFIYTRELEGLVAGDNTLSFTFDDGLAISNCDTTTPFVVNLFVHETPTEDCLKLTMNEQKKRIEFNSEFQNLVNLSLNNQSYSGTIKYDQETANAYILISDLEKELVEGSNVLCVAFNDNIELDCIATTSCITFENDTTIICPEVSFTAEINGAVVDFYSVIDVLDGVNPSDLGIEISWTLDGGYLPTSDGDQYKVIGYQFAPGTYEICIKAWTNDCGEWNTYCKEIVIGS